MKSRFVSLLGAAIAAVLSVSAAVAAEVTSDEAAKAAETWVSQNGGGLADSFGATAESVTKETVQGTGFHVVKMAGGGVVVLSADTTRRPVILALAGTEFPATEANPAVALLVADLKREPSEASAAANAKAWRMLTRPPLKATSGSAPSDLRVAGLVTTHWSQNLDKSNRFCYDYYTPEIKGESTHTPAGCAPVAVAQIMNYFEYPAAYPDYTRKEMWIENPEDHYEDITLVNAGEAIPWDMMLDRPGADGVTTTDANRQAIGALCFNAGLAGAASIYGFAGTSSGDIPAAFRVFGYSNAQYFGYDGNADAMQRVIRANLNAKRPLYITIPGHAIVCDGYGYSLSGDLYVRLNMGWSWDEHAWYSQPAEGTEPVIEGGLANIYTTEPAESVILSGRVTGGAATVKAINRDSFETYSAAADAKGIYALLVPPGRYVAYIDVNGRYSPPRVIDMYAGVSGDVADFDFEAASATSSTEPTLQLPAGYTAVEYIESDGRQTLNTGILPTETQAIAMRFSHLRDNGQFLMTLLCSGANLWSASPRFAVESGNYKFGTIGWTAGAYDSDTDCLNLSIDLNGGVDGNGAVWGWYQLWNETKGDWQGATYAGKGFTDLSNPYCLFSDGNGDYATSFRLYSFTVTDNGVLKGDFVPCRDAAGRACLWDKVTGQPFYDTTGNGFMAPPLEGLPAGYTALDFIESTETGGQYINTGYTHNFFTRIVCDMRAPASQPALNYDWFNQHALFGSQITGDALGGIGYAYTFYLGWYGLADAALFTHWSFYGGYCGLDVVESNQYCWNNSFPLEQRVTIDCQCGSDCRPYATVTPNGPTFVIYGITGVWGNGQCPMYIFAADYNNAPTCPSVMRLYGFRIYEGELLMRDLVPCRNAGGVAGLFDRVMGGFYPSANGVSFVGSDDYVAEINGTSYLSLAAAFAAAKSGDTVTLLKDASEGFTLPIGVAFDTNGKQYTGTVSAPANYRVVPAGGVYALAVELPAAYTAVDYIESDGSQYIDTEYVHKSNTRVECVVSDTAPKSGNNYGAVFGARNGGKGNNAMVFFTTFGSVNKTCYSRTGAETEGTAFFNSDKVQLVCEGQTAAWSKVVDPTQKGSITTTGTADDGANSMFIFNTNTGSGTGSKTPDGYSWLKMKLYSFRISEGDEVKRDYVPCRRDSDHVAGLFDAVTGEFYPSSTGTNLLAPNPYGDELPARYTALSYIESDGSQSIDTGVRPVSTTRVEMEFSAAKDLKKSEVFFSAGAWSCDAYHFCVMNNEASASRHFMFGNSSEIEFNKGGQEPYGIAGYNGSRILNYRFVVGDGCLKLYDRDTKDRLCNYENLTISVSKVNSNLTLFKAPSGTAYPSAFKLYSFKIAAGDGSPQRDFVPCYDTESGKHGLYDRVTAAFYGDANGGDFIGSDVATIGGDLYESLADAAAAATRGETITLLRDTDEGFTLPLGVAFATNGKTYAGAVSAPANHKAVLENGVYTLAVDPGEGYTPVAYIESDGNQYIDTGIRPDSTTRVEMEFSAAKDLGTSEVFFSAGAWSKEAYHFCVLNGHAAASRRFMFGNAEEIEFVADGLYGIAGYNNSAIRDYRFVVGDGCLTFYERDTGTKLCEKTGLTISVTKVNSNLTLFKAPSGDAYPSACKLYSFKIATGDGVLQRDFVPCRRDSDHVAGLFDGVTGEFYPSNSDTGFLAPNPYGDELPEDIAAIEYIESTGAQYVDSKVKAKPNTKAEMQVMVTGAGNVGFFGAVENGLWFSPYRNGSGNFASSLKNSQDWTGGTPATPVVNGTRYTVTLDAGAKTYTVNGQSLTCSQNTLTGVATTTIVIGGRRRSNSVEMLPCRIYSFKLWEGEDAVRDFVPCRNAEGVAGLYDKVTAGFYPSATGTKFNAPWPSEDWLPDGYTKVEFIESTGAQYIDTGVKPVSTTRVEMEFAGAKDLHASEVFFSAGAWSMNAYHFCVLNNGSGASRRFMFGNDKEISFEENGLYGIAGYNNSLIRNYRFVVGNGCLTLSDRDTKAKLHESTGLTISVSAVKNNLTLFKAPSGDAYPSAYRLYSFKIATGDGVSQRDFVPCRRDSDLKPGLYDRVSCTFYPNNASGADFLAPWPYEGLPEGFTKVAFIEGTGTQYIDSKVKARQNTRVEADMQVTTDSPGGKGIFGSIGGSSLNFSIYSSGDGYVASCLGKGQDWTKTDMKFDTSRRLYVLDANNNGVLLVDGASKTCSHNLNATGTSQYNIDICARNYDGNHNVMPCRVYGFKILEGGTSAGDFVPCRRDSDKKPGLYDRVTMAFYPNNASGADFIAPWPYEGLPEGYTQIGFIEGTGTQYIDTGVKAKQNTRVEADMQVTTIKGATGIFGSIGDSMDFAIYGAGNSTGSAGLAYCLGKLQWQGAGVNFDTSRHVYTLDAGNGVLKRGDKVLVKDISHGGSGVSKYTIPIGARNNNGSIDKMPCRIFGFKIYEGETPVRDLVPCRNANGVAGLYDLVTSVFYPSSSSTAFVSGDQWSVTISGSQLTRTYPADTQDPVEIIPYLRTVNVTLNGTPSRMSYLLCSAGSLTDDDVAKIGVAGAPDWRLELKDGEIYLCTDVPPTFVVTLDAQGGTGGTAEVTATLDEAMPSATMPTKDGYGFLGYFDAPTGGTQYYTAAGESARNWDKGEGETLYAQWAASGAPENPWSAGDATTVSTNGTGGATIGGTGKATSVPVGLVRNLVKTATIADGVTEIGELFFKDFRKMSRVEGGKGLVRFGDSVFYRCFALEEISIDNPDFEVDSLKDAIVYRMAVDKDGKFFMVPKVTIAGYTEMLYGKKSLADAEWTQIGPLAEQNLEELKKGGVYHFFQTRLEKVVE